MIEKIYLNQHELTCDNCGVGAEFKCWQEVLDFLKTENLQRKLVDGKYEHYCSDCRC